MPNPTELVESANKRQSAQSTSDKFREEIQPGIFTLAGGGTAFRAPDGRVVTAFDNINGKSEIIAEQNGKRYRLGKNIQIDDINGLAVLDFVDAAPPQPAKPLSISKCSLRPNEPVAIAGQVSVLDKPVLDFGQFQKQTTEEDLPQDHSWVPGGLLRYTIPLRGKELDDAKEFTRRPLLEFSPAVVDSRIGGPVLTPGKDIVGLTVKSVGRKSYAIPAEKISRLLELQPGESKFVVTSGHENGVQKYFRDWQRDQYAAWMGTGVVAEKTLALGGIAGFRPLMGVAVFSTAFDTKHDFEGLCTATNNRDKLYYRSALASDALGLAGLALYCFPRTRPLGKLLYGTSVVGRGACELIPNRYVIQKIERRDGDPRPPFASSN